MTIDSHPTLMLRFRDLVTEPGGNIAEHRRIIRQRGYAWWGWWARQHEIVPRTIFAQLFAAESPANNLILFDTGMMRLYRAVSGKVVIAPSHVGVSSPDLEATPDYYVRGRYPAWFRLEEDIVPIADTTITVLSRPTVPDSAASGSERPPSPLNLEALRDDQPTLWVIAAPATP